MECKVTCFDRVMNLVMPLPKDKYEEAVKIIQEWSFQDLLDFLLITDVLHKYSLIHCMMGL